MCSTWTYNTKVILTCATSCFSNSSSWRRKPKLGEAHGLAALTAARDSTQPRPVTVMMYAPTRVTLRDTPATLKDTSRLFSSCVDFPFLFFFSF